MANNEILQAIRDSLSLDDGTMIQIFRETGREIGQSTIDAFMKTEDQDDYIPCSNPMLGFFLDGLIIHKRGRQEGAPVLPEKPALELTNNAILKKLRIALDLKEADLVEIFNLAGINISAQEITSLFRKQGNKHYKECTPLVLNSFLKGVSLRQKP